MKTPYQMVSIQDVLSALTDEELYFDTETDGLYGSIELAQFYQESWSHVLIVKQPDPHVVARLLNKNIIVMQNASYDISTIQAQTELENYVPARFEDILLLSRLYFYRESSFSLDNLMLYALGYDPYLGQELDKKALQKTKWRNEHTEEQLTYAATDVYYMPSVYNKVKKHLEDQNYTLDITTLRHCLIMQNSGFPVNEAKRVALEMRNQMVVDELAVPVNVNSWKQVRPYIGEEESDGLALARFTVQGNQKAADVRVARKKLKCNSFLKKFETEDGRIYGRFSPTTRSGRLACKEQNLQQLPRATKGVFGYTKREDKVLIYSDFSQLELRSACAIIGETRMAKLYYANEDLHSYVQERIPSLVNNPQGRQIAKTCNFNLLYGGSAQMLGKILLKDALILLSDKELYKLKAHWLTLWPSIAQWQQDGIQAWDHGEAWKTPLGRRYLGKLMTDQLNIQIQGSGADVAKLAFHKMMMQLREYPEAKMCNFIHDSYIIEAPDSADIYSPIAQLVAKAMSDSWKEVSQYFKIRDLPMPVEVAVGKNWGDIENDEIDNIYNYIIEE